MRMMKDRGIQEKTSGSESHSDIVGEVEALDAEHLQRGALDEENDAALGSAEAVPERELHGPGDRLPRRGALPHGGHLLQAAHHVVNWEPLALAGYVGEGCSTIQSQAGGGRVM
jgi:hypothetical protein